LKGTRLIVVSALCLTGLLNLSPIARADPVAVRVVPRFDPASYAKRGAVGLLVPGIGGTVTRAGALASLERGKVEHSLLGGVPGGKVLVVPSEANGSRVTIYVSLPPSGRTPNHMRYPVAVVGCGFRGLLTSSATRVPGLVSIADIAHAVQHLRASDCDASPFGWKPSTNAAGSLRTLDHRIHTTSHAQGWLLVAILVAGVVLALLGGAAGVLACIGFVVASLILSALGVESFWVLILGDVGIASFAVVALRWRTAVPFVVTAFFIAFLVVLVRDPALNSLGVLGAHLDGGGRFYGVTNQLETLLLAPAIVAAAADGLVWPVGFGLLVLVTIAGV